MSKHRDLNRNSLPILSREEMLDLAKIVPTRKARKLINHFPTPSDLPGKAAVEQVKYSSVLAAASTAAWNERLQRLAELFAASETAADAAACIQAMDTIHRHCLNG